jgi:hypothetical protein
VLPVEPSGPEPSARLLRPALAVGLLVATSIALAASAGATATTAWQSPQHPVVLILAEQLDWAHAPSELGGWAKASLSLHSAGSSTDEVNGLLTIGKARRAVGLGPLATVTATTNVSGQFSVPGWKQIQQRDRQSHYGGKLGAFGQVLEKSGRSWKLITDDPETILAAADEHGTVRNASWGGAPDIIQALQSGTDITIANASTPAALPALIRAASGACTMVATVSSPLGYTHLGVFAASPSCGLGHSGLISSSTRQPPFMALIDVAPTVLDRVGLPRASSMIGQPARRAGPVTSGQLARENTRAHRTLAAHTDFTWFFIAASSLVAALMLVCRRVPLALVATAAALPVATFLIMLVPWWFHGAWAGAAVCAGIAIIIGGAAASGLGRRPNLCLGAIAGLTVVVLIGDGVRGGTLELDAPFGNSPTIAGRFDGIGNVAFGFSMGAALVACALALHHWQRRAVPGVLLVCAVFALAGAPALGDKVGLVPVWVPAAGVLLASSGAGRIRLKWVLLLIGVALVLLGCFAAYDLTRSSTSQSHLGRWLSSGDTLDTVTRKTTSMLRSFRSEPTRLLLPIPLLLVGRHWRVIAQTIWLRSLCLALVVAMVLGSLLEDSGVAVGVAVLASSWPALAWFAETEQEGQHDPPSIGRVSAIRRRLRPDAAGVVR